MHQYQERDGEEDRNPGGKTRIKEIRKLWGGRTGQSGNIIFSRTLWPLPFRRPQMMRKARGEDEEEDMYAELVHSKNRLKILLIELVDPILVVLINMLVTPGQSHWLHVNQLNWLILYWLY